VREAREEAGIVLDEAELVWFSHWTPPPISPKRFGTWFFATYLRDAAVDITVDGDEIEEHTWVRPADAMRRRDALEIDLSPPTWITLEHLARLPVGDAGISLLRATDPTYFATRIASIDDIFVALYAGDAGYESVDATSVGPRHRLVMDPAGWRYERDDW
jgi:hypothetical protein